MADLNNTPVGVDVNGITVDVETLKSILGEGIHTGLRKGSEAPSAMPLWRAISASDDGAWGDALGFAIWGLRYMGYDIVKVVS